MRRTLLVALIAAFATAAGIVGSALAAAGDLTFDQSSPPYTDPFGARLHLSGVRAIPSRFAAAGRRGHQRTNGPHLGTRVRFTLSAAARVTIAITSTSTGRRNGALVRHAHQGTNSVPFSGRFNGRALTPGLYRATVRAEAPHLTSPGARILRLTIVKG